MRAIPALVDVGGVEYECAATVENPEFKFADGSGVGAEVVVAFERGGEDVGKEYVGTQHLDMYRVESEEELYELGVSESVGEENAVTVIEWNKLSSLDGRIISVDIKPLGETDREFVFVSDEADKPIEEPQESVKVTE